MKYKVGDKVRVRKDLEFEEHSATSTWVNKEMLELAGETFTIKSTSTLWPSAYFVKENSYCWTEDMLEPADRTGKFPHIDEITKSLGLKEGDKILVNGAEYTVGVLGLINDKGDYANLKSILGQSFKIIPKPRTGVEILAHLKELRGDWEPDWNDGRARFCLAYAHLCNDWVMETVGKREALGALFFSEETIEKAVEYLNTLTEEESMNLLKEMKI